MDSSATDSSGNLASSRSERDISEPRKAITVVHSSPEVTLKSILKTKPSNGKMEATDSGPPTERKVNKVQWLPQVEVIYYAGDSVVGINKEDLSDEKDQLERKAAYALANTRIIPTLDRAPLLDEVDLLLP